MSICSLRPQALVLLSKCLKRRKKHKEVLCYCLYLEDKSDSNDCDEERVFRYSPENIHFIRFPCVELVEYLEELLHD